MISNMEFSILFRAGVVASAYSSYEGNFDLVHPSLFNVQMMNRLGIDLK